MDAPAQEESRAGSAIALVVVAAASALSALDLFVVNLAFSSIRDSFAGATNQSLSWVLNVYAITFAALLVPAGRLADRFGRKAIFQRGMLLFTLASLACAVAPNVEILILARALKGAGAALMIPTSLGLLLAAYPRERHKQMVSIWGATGGVAAALGPVIGGLLVGIDWRLIFLINLPIAIPALILSRRLVETPTTESRIPDLIGSAFLIAGIASLVAAISYESDWGIRSSLFWSLVATGVASLAIFIWRCLHVAAPALDLGLFRSRRFTIATLGMATFYTAFSMLLLGGTLYLRQVWHFAPARAGLGFGLGPATAAVAGIIGGRRKSAPQWLALVGASCFVAAGTFWLVMLGDTPSFLGGFLPGLMLTGVGAGLAQTGFIATGASALAASDYATGTGVMNTARQIGGAIGVAILVALTGSASSAGDFHGAWIAIASLGFVSACAALALRERSVGRAEA